MYGIRSGSRGATPDDSPVTRPPGRRDDGPAVRVSVPYNVALDAEGAAHAACTVPPVDLRPARIARRRSCHQRHCRRDHRAAGR